MSEAFSAKLLLGAVGLVGAAAEAELAVAAAAMALVNCVPEVPLPPRLSQNRADPLQSDFCLFSLLCARYHKLWLQPENTQ